MISTYLQVKLMNLDLNLCILRSAHIRITKDGTTFRSTSSNSKWQANALKPFICSRTFFRSFSRSGKCTIDLLKISSLVLLYCVENIDLSLEADFVGTALRGVFWEFKTGIAEIKLEA